MLSRDKIRLSAADAETVEGQLLLHEIIDICHDGVVHEHEIASLVSTLSLMGSDIKAVCYLKALLREVLADGRVDEIEVHRVKLALADVATDEVRNVVLTHLVNQGVPPVDTWYEEADWKDDPATSRQIEYIVGLGGKVKADMTKGEASRVIDRLLRDRPPSPRQKMLLRFFDRLDLMDRTKDEVIDWIDGTFSRDVRYEIAWRRYKRESGHDPISDDVSSVPVGAFRRYM